MNQYFFSFILFFLFSFNANTQTNCTINAGANATWCGSQGIHLDGHAAGVIQGKTLWKQISGPASTIQDAAALQTDVLPPLAAGVYVFELSVTCGQGIAVQQVTHIVGFVQRPDAGADISQPCYTGAIKLNPRNTAPSGYNSEWTLSQGKGYEVGGYFYPDTSQLDYCPQNGDYILFYSFINIKGCRFDDSLKIHIEDFVPKIKTRIVLPVCGNSALALGSCPGKNGKAQWTVIEPAGGGGLSFSSPTSTSTSYSGMQTGTRYIIEYKITNPNCGTQTKYDTVIGVAASEEGTQARLDPTGYKNFQDQYGNEYIYFCGIPDSIVLEGNLPNIHDGEKSEWSINPTGFCDVWTCTIRQPQPTTITLTNKTLVLKNLSPGLFEVQYQIVCQSGCLTTTKLNVLIMQESEGISYYTSNNCEDKDLSKFNIGCRTLSRFSAINVFGSQAFYHFPIPTDLVPILSEGLKFIVDGVDFKPINAPNATFLTKADMCFNNTTHQYQYFINISKDAPTGTYIYEIPVVYGSAGIPSCNGSKARFIIDFSSPPDTARGGTDQLICGMSTGLAGNTVKTPEWKFLSVQPKAAATPVIASPNSIVTNVSGMSIDATYKFLYRSYGGEFCGSTYDTVTVRTAQFPPPQPNAGADQNICSGGFVQLRARPSPIPAGVEGTWTVVSPSGANLIFTDIHDPDARVSGLIPRTSYTLRFTLRNGCDQSGNSDDVVITVSATPGANAPDAGRDKCLPLGTTSITLAASPLAPTGTAGLWSQAAGNPPGASISNPAVEITQASGLTSGTYRFVWKVSLAPCPAQADTVVITIGGSKAKVKESLIKICNNATPLSATLEAEAPQGPSGRWIQTDGATALIQSPASPITSVTGLMPGIYKFLWVINNGVCSSSKEVELRIGRTTPIADAGIDQVHCPKDSIINLSAIPAPSGMIGFWSIEDIEPGVSSIGVDFLPSTEVTNPKAKIKLMPGRNRLRWNIIADPVCGDQPSIDDVIIDYIPEATLPFDTLKLCNASTVPLESTFPGLAATGIWSQISGPQTSGLPHPTTDAAPLMLGLSGPGIYVFEYCISSNDCPTTCDRVTVINSPTFAVFPVKDRDTICAKNEILLKGAALAPGFTARWEYIRGPVGSWQINYSPNANSNDVTVSPVQNGVYQFRYIVSNGGCELSTTIVDSVRVGGIDAGQDIDLCSQSQVKLLNAPPLHKWSIESDGLVTAKIDSATGQVTEMDSFGTYFFKLSGTDGCYDVIEVNRLGSGIKIISPPNSIQTCVGGSIPLVVNVAPSFGIVRYQWQKSSNGPQGIYSNIGTNSNNFIPDQNTVGTCYYRVLLSNTANNCTDTSDFCIVEVVDDPVVEFFTQDTGACLGQTIVLIASVKGGIGVPSYSWEQSSSSQGPWTPIGDSLSLIAHKTLGVFYYKFNFSSSGNACDNAVTSTIKVSIDSLPTHSLQAMDLLECKDGEAKVQISLSNGATVSWTKWNPLTFAFEEIGDNNTIFEPPSQDTGLFLYKPIISSINGFCKDTGALVKITVVDDPHFETTLKDIGICEHSFIELKSLGAKGGINALNYQWQSAPNFNGLWTDINGATNLNYMPNGMPGNRYYRLIAYTTGEGCDTAFLNPVKITIDPKIQITADLFDKVNCIGKTDTLKLIAGNNLLNYSWRVANNSSGPYLNIGTNKSELIINTNSAGTRYFYVGLSSENGYCKDTSVLAKVEILPDPKIIVQVRDTQVCIGNVVELKAEADTSQQTLNIQWQIADTPNGPWTDIPSATTTKWRINTSQSGTKYYRMVARSLNKDCNDAITRVAEIKVNSSIAISSSPQGFTECIGGNQSLNVSAIGSNQTFQWQSSKDNVIWTNINGAINSNFIPPSNKKDSTYYRCIVIDSGNKDCGSDTSKAALVRIHTEFSILKDTVEVCNSSTANMSTLLDFGKFILSGDPNANWQIINGNIPPGPWSAKDFTGYPSGSILKFIATTTDQNLPCINVSDTLIVKVILCCPSVCTQPIKGVLCNQSQTGFDLQNMLCSGTQAGSWSIISGPGITQAQSIVTGILIPAQYQAGEYTVQYKLNNNIGGCKDTSTQKIIIVKAPEAGNALQSTYAICEKKDSIIDLNTALNGQDLGGEWKTNDVNIQSVISKNGKINLATISDGKYKIRYVVEAQGCSSDSVELEFNIDKAPFVDAGEDGRLSCDTPTVFIGNSLNSSGQNVDIKWTLIGGVISDPSRDRFEAGTPGRYLLEVRDKSTGCTSNDTVDVIAAEAFITDVNSNSRDPKCYGEKNAIIEVNDIKGGTAPFTFVLLDQGSKELSRNSTGKFVSLSPGKYTIRIEDKNGCITTRTYEIVEPAPLDVVLLRDTTISCRDSVYLEVQTGIDPRRISELKWYGDGTLIDTLAIYNRTLHPQNTTRYSIRVRDNNGCFVESAATVKVDLQAHVYAPNVFSPNGDNLNDLFKLVYSENVDYIFSFAIYDRWGEQMYIKQNFYPTDEHGWNGKYRTQDCNPGVLVWVAKIRACDDRIETIYGDVTLLR